MKKLFILIFILCLFGCSHKAREPVTDDAIIIDQKSDITFVSGTELVITTDNSYLNYTVSKEQYKNVKYTEDKENFYIKLIPREDKNEKD